MRRRIRKTSRLLIPLIAGFLASTAPAASYELGAAEATQALNLQRETNRIPAGITDRPAWDEACTAHINWLSLNPWAWSINPHLEIPGTPGYTEAGAWAGVHSDLVGQLALSSNGTTWYDGWEEAPYHLFPLLAPSLTEIGYVPGCVVASGGPARAEPTTPQILTYPGNGTDFVVAWEKAEEWPNTPAPLAGLPENKITGPYIFVFAWGAGDGDLTGAALRGPSGPVEVRIVDYVDGGFVVPPAPLTVGATYIATVTYTRAADAAGESEGPPITHEWSFTVARPGRVVEGPILGPPTPMIGIAPAPSARPKPALPRAAVAHIVHVAHNRRLGTAILSVRLTSPQPATVTLTGSGVRAVRTRAQPSALLKLKITPTPELLRRLRHEGSAIVRVHLTIAQVDHTNSLTTQVIPLVFGRLHVVN